MMDLHMLIVISCVFLASLCSLLFINKFFRRKTFEEIIAEKKALNEKIYQSKAATATAAKKPKKLQQLKKELKREKKQRQKEQQKDNNNIEQEDSDAQSEEQASVEEEPQGLSKTHVEFEPDPEVVTYNAEITTTRAINTAEKENVAVSGGNKQKSKKDKKGAKAAGILVNKNEPLAIKENPVAEELNSFEVKAPKDFVELKKQEKKEEKEKEKQQQAKKEKSAKKEKHVNAEKVTNATTNTVVEPAIVELPNVAKELKQQEEKVRQGSPKNQQHTGSNKSKQKKQNKETTATKDLVLVLDKLSETDTIGVSLLMNLFRHAELNRSEIQILIDYLLNKQQDTPSSHSEWSDDICQKLKRQLEEKERALTEEQEASIGIQAKLRELRTEINTERAQMNATIKAYIEKLQGKEQEITGLNQEVQALNDKITLERQQFQAKLVREKQAGSQDLLAQLQLIQNELAHKDKCIAELTCMLNASRQAVDEAQQKNEIIQTQVQQIRALEQQREELEQVSNNRIFELEKAKTIETENAEIKVELLNLQNANESSKADAAQARKDLEAAKSELTLTRNVELGEKQQEIQTLHAKNVELSQQLAGYSGQAEEQSREQSSLQVTLDALKKQLAEQEKQLADFNAKNAELLQQVASEQTNAQQSTQQQKDLQKLVEALQADVASKHQQLQEVQQQTEKFGGREQELLQQLQEQKEKNNEIRMKNWKLVEALQNAETTIKQNKTLTSANASLVQQEQLLAATTQQKAATATATNTTTTVTATESAVKEQQQIRELFQRLYPDAVKACASTALSASFDQWIEQVLATHIKQSTAGKTNASNNNKSTQSNNSNPSSNHSSSTHNSHSNNNTNSETNNSNSRISGEDNKSSSSSSSSGGAADTADLNKVNAELRIQIDELTKLVTKTDEHWRGILLAKEEQIQTLQHSNGEQAI